MQIKNKGLKIFVFFANIFMVFGGAIFIFFRQQKSQDFIQSLETAQAPELSEQSATSLQVSTEQQINHETLQQQQVSTQASNKSVFNQAQTTVSSRVQKVAPRPKPSAKTKTS